MKNKTILFIILIAIIILIFVLIGFSFNQKTEEKEQSQSYTYMIGKGESEEAKVVVIHTFDGNKCIDTRIQYTFDNKNDTEKCYENWKDTDNMTNVTMLNDYTIIANTNTQNGRNKKDLQNSYTDMIIEEY